MSGSTCRTPVQTTVAMGTGGLRVTTLGQQQKELATRKQLANPSTSWGRCKGEELEDDDSWEVRAFAEDTSGLLGTTWPPRSYTCTFCRREFRSAQALGGHMNVHRRDRARLRGSPASGSSEPSLSPAPPAPPAFSSPEFVPGGGLCLFYQVPAVGAVFLPTASPNSTSSGPGNIGEACSCLPVAGVSQVGRPPGPGRTSEDDDSSCKDGIHGVEEVEELDLELRLGR